MDANNRLSALTTTGPTGTVLQQFTYTLDNTGRRTAFTELDGRTTDYTLDDGYRLTEVRITPAGGATDIVNTYTYDAAGNRTYAVEDGVSTAYVYDANDRLLSAGAQTFTYDANGNQRTVTEGTVLFPKLSCKSPAVICTGHSPVKGMER